MTAREFCYWLQGYFELRQTEVETPVVIRLTDAQVVQIRAHLALVFQHDIDPSVDKGDAALAQKLQSVHDASALLDSLPKRPPGVRC